MKDLYLKEIKNAFKSKEYLFAISLIILSIIVNLKYFLDDFGSMSINDIGAVEFFIIGIIDGNNLLQISAPAIPIFAALHSSGIYNKVKDMNLSKAKKLNARIISTAIIASSVFVFSYIIILLFGFVITGRSLGTIQSLNGLFSTLYNNSPLLYFWCCMGYACFFSVSYSMLGMGIGINLSKGKSLSFYIPLVFYNCFRRVQALLPDSVNSVLNWVSPYYTFSVSISDDSLYKRAIEMGFVLVCGLLLIYVAYKRKKVKL